jgi:hypothetical protein
MVQSFMPVMRQYIMAELYVETKSFHLVAVKQKRERGMGWGPNTHFKHVPPNAQKTCM